MQCFVKLYTVKSQDSCVRAWLFLFDNNSLVEKTDKILIGCISIMGFLVIILLVAKKIGRKLSKPQVKKTGHMFFTTLSGHIISLPNAEQDEYSLLLIFGGIPPYGGDWMKNQIPDAIYEKYVVVLPKYHNSPFADVTTEYNAFLEKKEVKISDKSIFGFSGGGIRAQENISAENWTMVGLIDPSTRNSFLTLPLSDKIKMIYNAANWSGYPAIRALLPQLASKVTAAGGYATASTLTHLDIPKYFFEKIVI